MPTTFPSSDAQFDAFYSKEIRNISEFHFTPMAVAQAAAAFLVEKPGTKVLDIGSGSGKFCFVGAHFTKGVFTGVEVRKSLHDLAQKHAKALRAERTNFIFSNILDIDFQAFAAFYIFNPFYENIDKSGKINDEIELEKKMYVEYNLFVLDQLSEMPLGTKLATYFSYGVDVPLEYHEIKGSGFEKLRFWEKRIEV